MDAITKEIIKACGGILGASPQDGALHQAILRAEQAVGEAYTDAPQTRSQLIEMVELNLINRKQYPREFLNRRYGLQIGHNELAREKQKFCTRMAQELGLL